MQGPGLFFVLLNLNLHWLLVKERSSFKILITYKALHGLAPVCITDFLRDPQIIALGVMVSDYSVHLSDILLLHLGI